MVSAGKKLIGSFVIILLIIAATGVCAFGQSEDEGRQMKAPEGWRIGPGVVVTSKPYEGMDSEVTPIALLYYRKGRFMFEGRTASYRLFSGDRWDIAGLAEWRFDGYDSDESDDLTGMSDRRMSLDAGLEFSAEVLDGKAGIKWVTDTLGNHQGSEMQFAYSRSYGSKRLRISPSAGVSIYSSELADYYYGVQADETAAGRAAYDVDRAINPFAGLTVQYNVDRRWDVFTAFNYEWLDSEITDSPIVDDDYEVSLIAGMTYRF